MKKIKMKFPDGSVREIDDADVATARSLGAVEFNETTPQKNGKKVTMQFGDGVIKEIDSADVAVAESLGGVKKKEAGPSSLGAAGAQTLLPTGTETTSTQKSQLNSVIDPSKYETKLPAEQESKFKTWLDKNYKEGKIQKGDYDFYKKNGYGYGYDFRAAFEKGEEAKINKQDGKWHWSDIGKKPNHPSFSTQSKYNNVDGFVGGTWDGEKFTPPETTGQSSSLLMSDTKIESIEDYNKQFENITGHHKFDLSAPTGKPGLLSLENFNRRKQEAEKRKFTEYRADEEDINKVRASAYFGSNSLSDELKTLATKPYGSQAIKQIISDYGGAVSPEAYQEDVSKIDFNEVAKNIIEKNRVNGVTALDNLDTRAKTDIENATKAFEIKTGMFFPSGGGATKEVITTDKIPYIDFNDQKSLSDAINFLSDKGYLSDKTGKKSETYDINKLSKDLDIVLRNLVSKNSIDPAIENISQNIGSAVTDHFMRSNKDVKAVINEGEEAPDYTSQINTQTEHFKAGLNYVKFLGPGVYKNVVRALTDKNEISARDYTQISRLGQDIVNENVFRKSATDPSLIGAETSYDYNTKEERKAVIAGEIGELAKAKGYKGIEFSQNLVNRLGRELGYSGDDSEIVQELALEEGIGGYDAIPKSGGVNAFLRGFQQPFSGIGSTFKKLFVESPAETYLRSKRLDVGSGQKVPDAKGQFSEELASDRNNVWYDVLEGTGQFIPQVLLTRGIGAPLAGASSRIAVGIGGKAATAAEIASITNYGGTFISQYLQTFGDAYSAALQKTGDPGLARLMGGIDATTTAFSEFILPDIKIAEKAFSGLKKNLITDIAGVFKKGAGLSELRQKSRPFIEKFFTEAVDISRQEVSEEVLSQWANYLDEAIFSPKTVKDRDFAQETWDTINGTAKALLVPSLFGAGGVALNKDFSVQGLHASALNFEKSKNDLQDALGNGAITQDEYNNSIKLLQTHRNNLFTAPTDNGFGQPLSKQQVFDFAFQETNLQVLKDELKNTDSNVQKELINQKIKTAEDIQRDILFKENTEVKKPSDTIKKPESNIESAVIEVNGKQYEGKNHAEAILKAKADGQDISKVERKAEGKFKLSDGTIIDRAEAKKRFGQDRSELLITQDEAANQANKDYEKLTPKESIPSVAKNISESIGGKVVGSASKEGTTPRDIDIRIEGEYNKDATEKKMTDLGYENRGSSLVSPEEAKQSGKEYADGWQRAQHFENAEGQKIDIWHNEPKEQKAPSVQFRTPEQANKIISDADKLLTVQQRALPRDIPDIVDPDKKKTSVKDLKNRYNALQELIVNCLR